MKKLTIYCLMLLFSGAFMTSCSKDDGPVNEPVDEVKDAEYYFTCELDGQAYLTKNLNSYAASFDDGLNLYGINGNNTGDVIYVHIPNGVTEGTHTFDDDFYAVMSLGDRSFTTLLGGESEGTITITKVDGLVVEGSFDFIATDYDDFNKTTRVTNGVFRVKERL